MGQSQCVKYLEVFFMYFIGIDISKYKHDCFIMNENNQVIRGSFSFDNSQEGFNTFLDVLKSLDRSQEIKIGLEATGHYGNNLKLFLNDNGYSFMEFNPLLVKRFASSHSLRRTKTDKCDASLIATILTDATIEYKPYRFSSYHIKELKSLTRERESMIKQRSLQLVHLTNTLDKIFPEYKQFFNNKLSNTALFILDKFKSPSRIAKLNNHDIEIIHNYSYIILYILSFCFVMFELYTFSNGSPYCLIHKTRFCFTKKQIITPYIFLIKFLYGDIRIFSRYVLIF